MQRKSNLEDIVSSSDIVVVDTCNFIAPLQRRRKDILTSKSFFENLRGHYYILGELFDEYENLFVDFSVFEEIKNHNYKNIKKRMKSKFARLNPQINGKLTEQNRALEDRKVLIKRIHQDSETFPIEEEKIAELLEEASPLSAYYGLTFADSRQVALSVYFTLQDLSTTLLTGDQNLIRAAKRFYLQTSQDHDIQGRLSFYSFQSLDQIDNFVFVGSIE